MPAGNNGSMLGWYCFEGHFIKTLLVDAYKFKSDDDWEKIHFVKKVMIKELLFLHKKLFWRRLIMD